MILTTEERHKFLAYLKQNAESCRLIIEKMEKLPAASILVPKEKRKLTAYLVIAGELEATESFTVESAGGD